MKNLFWIAAIILAFAAGYFSHSTKQEISTPADSSQIKQIASKGDDSHIHAPLPSVKDRAAPAATPTKVADTEAAKANAKQAALDILETTADPKAAAQKYPKEINDEEIDKVLPAPFNKSLKNNHGELREKYKEFSEANTSNDWDMNMQHKLTDFILSRPYAKFISVESLVCRANLCEIRLFESKNGAWQFILSEMALQDWWDFGSYGSSGLSPDANEKRGTAYLVLLSRKPAI